MHFTLLMQLVASFEKKHEGCGGVSDAFALPFFLTSRSSHMKYSAHRVQVDHLTFVLLSSG